MFSIADKNFLINQFLSLGNCYKSKNYNVIYSFPEIKKLSSDFFNAHPTLIDIELDKLKIIFEQEYSSCESLRDIFSFLSDVSKHIQGENLAKDDLIEVTLLHYNIAGMSFQFSYSYSEIYVYHPNMLNSMFELMSSHYNIAFEHFLVMQKKVPEYALEMREYYYPNMLSDTLCALSACDDNHSLYYYKDSLRYLRQLDALDDREYYVNSLIKKIDRFESKETRISLLNELLEDITQRINSGSAYEEDINLSNKQLSKLNFVYSKLEAGNSDVKAILLEWESSNSDANYEGDSEHEEESEYDTESGSNSDANTDGNYEYDVETGSSKVETAQLKLESPNVGILLDEKTSPSLLIGNGETNRPYQITSQDTYYVGYFFSKVFLKPLIQCKNNEYKAVNNSSIENSYDYTTCVMNETFNGKNLIGALVAPSIHLINKVSSPEMILLNAASIHLLYAVYSEDYLSYATDLVLQTFSNFILGYPSFLLMQQNNYVPQDNFLQASLTGVLTPIATDLFKLGNNFFFNDDGNIHS